MTHWNRWILSISTLACVFMAAPAVALPGTCLDRIAGEQPGGLSGPTSVGSTIAEDQRERKEVSSVPFFD